MIYKKNHHVSKPDNKNEALLLINEGERIYRDDLTDALADILHENKRVITLAGPTCSGKTTTANFLLHGLTNAGLHVKVLSIDDFFRDRLSEKLVPGAKEDLDSVRAIDLDYLGECVRRLLSDKTVLLPTYDFHKGKRTQLTEYTPMREDVYLFEGIQAVYPEVTALFPPSDLTSIFINVYSGLEINGISFSPVDIRLLRRILRDSQFRSASPEYTLGLWESVRDNEERSILPYAENAKIDLDSLMPYELFIMAQRLPDLLRTVTADSPFYPHAAQLAVMLSHLLPNPFEESMVPAGSVLREFIGTAK